MPAVCTGRTAGKNRWKLRNHPLGHSVYIDLFVAVFDASMRFLANRPDRPRESFAQLVRLGLDRSGLCADPGFPVRESDCTGGRPAAPGA